MSYNNRLFATFTFKENLDSLIYNITSMYDILYKRIFVLNILNKNEYIITYNVEEANVNNIPESTFLVHRKKQNNVLYTINALNLLIKQLNNGFLDRSYQINWNNYNNSIILTQQNEIKILPTKIYKIINI